jgi:hypothetical protein
METVVHSSVFFLLFEVFFFVSTFFSIFFSSSPSATMEQEYIQQNVGDVLAEAIAQATISSPADPVDFIGKFLLQHVRAAELKVESEALAAKRKSQIETIHTAEMARAAEEERKKESILAEQKEFGSFLRDFSALPIDHNTNQLDILTKVLEGLKLSTKSSAGYAAKLVSENDLEYIASTSNNEFMLGKRLTRGNGVTFDLFEIKSEEDEQEEEDPDAPDPEDDSDEAKAYRAKKEAEKLKKKQELKVVHVPNVLTGPLSEKVHFFNLPNLGGFFGVRIQFESALHEEAVQKAGWFCFFLLCATCLQETHLLFFCS